MDPEEKLTDGSPWVLASIILYTAAVSITLSGLVAVVPVAVTVLMCGARSRLGVLPTDEGPERTFGLRSQK